MPPPRSHRTYRPASTTTCQNLLGAFLDILAYKAQPFRADHAHQHLLASTTPSPQLSKVYSEYGYDPAAGEVITGGGGVEVTGSGNRVVYKRPAADAEPTGRWGRYVGDPNFQQQCQNLRGEGGILLLNVRQTPSVVPDWLCPHRSLLRTRNGSFEFRISTIPSYSRTRYLVHLFGQRRR